MIVIMEIGGRGRIQQLIRMPAINAYIVIPRNQKKEHEQDDELKRNSASSSSTHFSQTPPRSEPSNIPEYSSKGCKTALEPILTPDEWREALNFFDHRRFITFGVIRGWIRRVHCFPLAYTSMTYPMAEYNTTIVGID